MNETGTDRELHEPLAARQRAALALIAIYRRLVSPFLPPACRFHPSCSDYAAESVRTHGVLRGTGLAVRRVCRCHPLSAGGFDPVPPRNGRRAPAPEMSPR